MKLHNRSIAAIIYFYFLIIFSIYFANINSVGAVRQEIRCPVESLYQLGDSIADTGNTIRYLPYVFPASRNPYGESFPEYPTGRWSDGRLIIDYIAMGLGLPLLNPYLDKNASISGSGVNFAVAASTALDSSFFLTKGIVCAPVPSLSVQLTWFTTYLDSIYSTSTEREDKLSKSVIFVGETGYNDIACSISLGGRSVEETYTYVPFIVQAIIHAIREVIKYGASQVVVPGEFPLGCFPWAIQTLGTSDPTSYDDIGCIKSLNHLTTSMNQQLQQHLDSIRKEFPNVLILYVDYYSAFYSILHQASTLGFNTTMLLKPCCGEATYNSQSLKFCGNVDFSVCPNPNTYIHWDGIHPTQEVYRRMSEIIIKDLKINCTS